VNRSPKIVLAKNVEKNSRKYSMIALDLDDEEKALALAKRLAEQTGPTVTVRESDQELLGTFRGPTKN
jgi:hypothetical protein